MSDAGTGPSPEPLSSAEREELVRLREQASSQPSAVGRGGRWFGSAVLLVLAALVSIATAVAVFVHSEVLNTDRYVATVAPLATDPAVRSAIANRISDAIINELNIDALTQRLVHELEQRGAPPILSQLETPIENGVRSFITKEVTAIVNSDQFVQVWNAANRAAHQAVDKVLTGHGGGAVTTNGTQVSINLGAVIDKVKQRLVNEGFSLANKIPNVSVTYPLFESKQLPKIRSWVKVLNTAAWVLPILTVLLFAAGVLVAPNRRRGLLVGSACLAVAMLVLLGVLAAARSYYLGHLPDTVRSPAAAKVLYDTVLRFLVQSAQTILILALIAMIGSWLVGPARVAGAIRHGLGAGTDAAAAGLGRLGLRLGPVPGVTDRNRRTFEVIAVVGGLFALVIWRHPGVSGTLWTTLVVVLVIGLIELISRLPGSAPAKAA